MLHTIMRITRFSTHKCLKNRLRNTMTHCVKEQCQFESIFVNDGGKVNTGRWRLHRRPSFRCLTEVE